MVGQHPLLLLITKVGDGFMLCVASGHRVDKVIVVKGREVGVLSFDEHGWNAVVLAQLNFTWQTIERSGQSHTVVVG